MVKLTRIKVILAWRDGWVRLGYNFGEEWKVVEELWWCHTFSYPIPAINVWNLLGYEKHLNETWRELLWKGIWGKIEKAYSGPKVSKKSWELRSVQNGDIISDSVHTCVRRLARKIGYLWGKEQKEVRSTLMVLNFYWSYASYKNMKLSWAWERFELYLRGPMKKGTWGKLKSECQGSCNLLRLVQQHIIIVSITPFSKDLGSYAPEAPAPIYAWGWSQNNIKNETSSTEKTERCDLKRYILLYQFQHNTSHCGNIIVVKITWETNLAT